MAEAKRMKIPVVDVAGSEVNLFDEDYEQRVFFFGNNPANGYASTRYESPAAPRQIGVSAEYKF